MRLARLRLQLRMELAAEIPRMPGKLANLDVHPIRSFARQPQAVALQHILVFAIEFVAVTMPLADLARAIQ